MLERTSRSASWVGACLALFVSVGAAAQSADNGITIVLRPGIEQREIDALLSALNNTGRRVTIRWEDKDRAGATPVAPKQTAPRQPPTGSTSPTERMGGLWESFKAGLTLGLKGISRLAELPRDFVARWSQDGAGTSAALGLVAAIIAAAALCGWGVGRALRALVAADPAQRQDAVSRLGVGLRYLFTAFGALGTFVIIGVLGITQLLPQSAFVSLIAESVLHGSAIAALYFIGGRFLFYSASGSGQLLPLPNPRWHFLLLTTYGVAGAIFGQTIMLAQRQDSDPMVIEGWFLIGATLLTLLKLWWFVAGRDDIAIAFRSAGRASDVGLVRRIIAGALPWLFVAVALLIWVVGCIAAAAPQAAHWGSAAGATQILVVALPIIALGVDALMADLIARRQGGRQIGALASAFTTVIRSVIVAALWVGGLYLIARVWNLYLVDPASADAAAALEQIVRITAILVVGWALWTFLRAYFRAVQHKSQRTDISPADAGEPQVQSRFATALPLIRNVLLGFVAAVTALVALSALGVDIGPLLAGLGVLGLAISFGSQTLVRDIVSGIFFMADDAFRIGEYIETDRLKGTVERISIRSLQLRHHRGALNTIPYGQIQSIRNYSRDWVIEKLEFGLVYGTDPEKVRKLIKKIGLDLMENSAIAPAILEPLKSQGMQRFGDSGLIFRAKIKCRPGQQFAVLREAHRRIQEVFAENGIQFAYPTFTISDGKEHGSEGGKAAAMTQTKPATA